MDRRSFIRNALLAGAGTVFGAGNLQGVANVDLKEIKKFKTKKERIPVPNGHNSYKDLKPKLPHYKKINPEIDSMGFVLPGEETKYGATTIEGKVMRTLRFKNLADAVEDRYDLPKGVLLALIMIESTGVEYLGNASGDGGFGLIHTQPNIAKAYGLKTFKNCNSLICNGKKGSCIDEIGNYKNHAKELEEFINLNKGNKAVLAEADERLNHLLNLDMIGRMLAYGMSDKRIKTEGVELSPFESAIYQIRAGLPAKVSADVTKEESDEKNKKKYGLYLDYMEKFQNNFKLLQDKFYLEKLKDIFENNPQNKDITLLGFSVGFEKYLNLFWGQNENFGLKEYRELPSYGLDIQKH